MSDHWELVHTFWPFRDFEPKHGLEIDGLSRITFDGEAHAAYGTKANPEATLDGDEPLSLDETVRLTWDEAERLVNA